MPMFCRTTSAGELYRGFALEVALSILSFFIAGTTLVWQPSIPVALAVLAIARMGVHLVFFLHTNSGRDNVNNAMALEFGALVIGGALWITAHSNHNMMPMDQLMRMRR